MKKTIEEDEFMNRSDPRSVFRETVMGLIALLVFMLLLTSCATSRHALTGAAVGGALGAITCGEKCMWIGGIVGGALGNEMDQTRIEKQHEAYWKKRAEMQQKAMEESVRIIEVDEGTEVIVIEDGKAIKY